MTLAIIPRAAWGAAPWEGDVHAVPSSEREEFFVHWHGGIPRHDRGDANAKEVEAIHLGKGWSGVGYNFLVGQDGAVREGRGWSLVGAHCPGHNRSGWGVYVAIGKDGDAPTKEALAAVRALYEEACRLAGKRLAMRGHRDGYETSCPGDGLHAWVRAGMPVDGPVAPVAPARKPAAKPSPAPVKVPSFPGTTRRGSRGSAVRAVQARLAARGWDIAADGVFGPATDGVVRAFQREKGLAVDGIVGPATWRALWLAKVTP